MNQRDWSPWTQVQPPFYYSKTYQKPTDKTYDESIA